MSEVGGIEGEGQFVPRRDVFSAGGAPEFDGTNASRAAALAVVLRFNTLRIVEPLAEPLRQLGFADDAIFGLGDERRLVAGLSADWFAVAGAQISADDVRRESWQSLNGNSDPTAALRFLIGVLGSGAERQSAAAAATLWRVLSVVGDPGAWTVADVLSGFDPRLRLPMGDWDPEVWRSIFTVVVPGGRTLTPEDRFGPLRFLVTLRLRLARTSADPVTRSFALALRLDETGAPTSGSTGTSAPTPPGALVVSTMVHGTRGWKGSWWRPKGGFHQFVATNHRPNLYGRGARFSWSGAYSHKQRVLAAEDLVDWTHEVAPNGLQTIFAHSYGGDVAAMAAMAGATTQELVLLSAPATAFANAAASSVGRVIDIRLPLDPVLCIANTQQRLAPSKNVTEVLLPWSLSHGSSHDEHVWAAHDVASHAGL